MLRNTQQYIYIAESIFNIFNVTMNNIVTSEGQIDTILATFDDKKLTGIAGIAKGICKAKKPED